MVSPSLKWYSLLRFRKLSWTPRRKCHVHRCSLDSAEIFCCCYFKMGFLMVAYRIFFFGTFFHAHYKPESICLFVLFVNIYFDLIFHLSVQNWGIRNSAGCLDPPSLFEFILCFAFFILLCFSTPFMENTASKIRYRA